MAACVAAILSVSVAAQEHATGISLKAVVVDDDIPAAAVKNIETKLQRALASNGIGDMDNTQRFVLAAKVDVVQNDVMPSNPPRVSKKLDLTLMVGDVVENKIYETCTMSLAGIGTNDAKAFVSAFSRVNPNNEDLQTMLAAAKETGRVVTVEEHSVIGGLGSAVCDVLSEKAPTKILKIGINDVFGESGPALELIKKYGLDADSIYEKVKEFTE